ncbi:MAG: protein kinase [Gemmatimonadales bacterium]
MPDRLAAALADRYRIERELGQGGMATVYLAQDLKHDRQVAIKVLKPELAAVLGAERFVVEIRTTAALQHPHILPLFDSGEAGGFLYYVMPYIEGETLRDKLNRETQLGIDEAVRITTEVADALDYAHRHGVIHRDIKPENILLHDGRPMVADFGIALALSAAAGGRMTETGMCLGTPHYMSPEQATADKEITGRSDVYSLASVLYEMLTGEPPHTGSSAQAIIMKIVTEEAAPVTRLRKTVPSNVAAALAKALEKVPADRFDSARAFAEALADPHFTTTAAVEEARVAGGNLRSFRSWIRSPWSWTAAVLVVAGAALAVTANRRASALSTATYEPWTFESQSIFNARFAPDRQTLIFDAMPAVGLTPRLFVIRSDHPDPTPIGPDSTHLLSVSRAGRLAILTHASYVAHRLFTGTLATMSLGTEAPRELAAGVREADWAPDDTSLAVIRDSAGTDLLEYPVGTVLVRSPGYLSDPRVSPSGDAVAYLEHPAKYDDRGAAVIVDRTGQTVARSPESWGLEGVAWRPDGRSILYSAAGAQQANAYQPRELDRSGRDRLVLSGPGDLIVQDISPAGRLLVTQDQTRYVVVGRGAGSSGERTLGVRDLSSAPVISPDGRHLAFADLSGFGGPYYTVLWRSMDGSPPVHLGEGGPIAVSADGGLVLALVYSAPPKVMLYPTGPGSSRRVDSGQFRSLGPYGAIRVTGTDTTVVFCGAEAGQASRCYLAALPGGTITPVTPPGTSRIWLSPDGSRMLGKADRFVIYPTDGGPPAPAHGFRPTDVPIRWSPDGRDIWAWSNPSAVSAMSIDRINPATGARASLVSIVPRDPTGVRRLGFLTLADDPHSYAFVEYPYMSRLFTVDGVR